MITVDFSYLEMLFEDDDNYKKEYIATFAGSYKSLAEKMQAALKSGDMDTLARAAHQLKPTAKMVKLPCASHLETWQHDPQKATQEGIEMVRSECEEAFNQMEVWATGGRV